MPPELPGAAPNPRQTPGSKLATWRALPSRPDKKTDCALLLKQAIMWLPCWLKERNSRLLMDREAICAQAQIRRMCTGKFLSAQLYKQAGWQKAILTFTLLNLYQIEFRDNSVVPHYRIYGPTACGDQRKRPVSRAASLTRIRRSPLPSLFITTRTKSPCDFAM
jgi:hypothetical protein